MRTLLSFLFLLFLMATAFAQSPSPTPPPSSTPTPEDRPTLNRPGSSNTRPSNTGPSNTGPSNTGLGSPSPTPTPHALPAAPAKAEENAEPPKPSYPDLLPRFDYDSHAGLEMRETDVQMRDKVRIIELNYAGASGDRVPAYLLIPPGGGPFPAIIWGHWLKKGSPLANKDEFLEEAAGAGPLRRGLSAD